MGYECTETTDGEEAWQAFLQCRADIVVSDWNMPRVDGAELCRRVRSLTDGPYCYFAMLTGLEDKAHMVEAMRAGVDDYLVKPFAPEDLEALFISAERVAALHRSLEDRARLAGVLLAAHTLEHELNNKLAITMGYAEMLERHQELPQSARKLAATARLAARQATEIVQRLLNITVIQERDWGEDMPQTIDLSSPESTATAAR
jgi:DNA-binding response OmpR family regulator